MSAPDTPTHAEVVDAVLRTLETLISQAARNVEEQTQELADHLRNCDVHPTSEHANAAITTIQFQDYNSQLAENALRLVKILRGNEADGERLLEACRGALTLGEIRDVLGANIKKSGEACEKAEPERGPIELF